MRWTGWAFRFVFALIVLAFIMDVCFKGPPTTISAQVAVYEDTDGDGRRDGDEAPISNVLVVPYPAGYISSADAVLTDAEGQVTVSVVFRPGPPPRLRTVVVSSCGYVPSLKELDTEHNVSYEVGFVPEVPRSGTAAMHFHLWNDRDGDGRQSGDEADLGSQEFVVSFDPHLQLGLNWQRGWEHTTDATGRATLDLGDSCSTLWVETGLLVRAGEVPSVQSTTIITPAGVTEGDWMSIPYDLGTTDVEWGLR